MEQQFESTANEMEDTTGQFEDLQAQWEGALGAIVGGVAVAVGGLMTQVPILGELGSALGSVLSAVGFQIDQLLRDLGAGGLVDTIFNFSDALYSAEGAAGDLVGVLGTVTSAVAGGIASYLAYIQVTQGLTATLSTVGGWLGSIASGIGTVVSGITTVLTSTLAWAAGLGVLIGTLGVAVLEITGVLDVVADFANWVGNVLPQVSQDFALAVLSLISPFVALGSAILGFVQGTLRGGLEEGVRQAVANINQTFGIFEQAWMGVFSFISSTTNRIVSAVSNMSGSITDELTGLADDALGWGEDLIEEFAQGIRNSVSEATDAVDEVTAAVNEYIEFNSPAETGPLSNLDESGPGLVETFADGISANVGTAANAASDLASASDPGGGGGFRANRSSDVMISLDGRLLNDQQGRYRDDETAVRGRNG
jgi:hypothetical protein